MLGAWIHHDNLLEGESFSPQEIRAALSGADADFDSYLHPLFARIRRYADAVRGVWTLAGQGPSAVTLDALKRLNAELNPDPADRGGLYRQTSPVHRDYFQAICAADKVPYHRRKLFEHIEAEAATTINPVALAADVHHRLMFAYPFRKQPGTTARLFTNLMLLAHGYPPAILPGGLRAEYYAALDAPLSQRNGELYGERNPAAGRAGAPDASRALSRPAGQGTSTSSTSIAPRRAHSGPASAPLSRSRSRAAAVSRVIETRPTGRTARRCS